MPPYECYCRVVRKVEVVLGEVEMECRARFRPDYGVLRPWICRAKPSEKSGAAELLVG